MNAKIGCYDGDNEKIQYCKCHSSCESCGFWDEPTDANNCISCADGSDVNVMYDDGTGYCGKISGCYKRYLNEKIKGCSCHSSCEACGYNKRSDTVLDCITCADGSEVNPVWKDGTGYCGKVQGCYDYYKGKKIPDCFCPSSCGACWFYDNKYDCISCTDGSNVRVYNDGVGYCETPDWSYIQTIKSSDVSSLLPSFRSSSQPSFVPSFQPSTSSNYFPSSRPINKLTIPPPVSNTMSPILAPVSPPDTTFTPTIFPMTLLPSSDNKPSDILSFKLSLLASGCYEQGYVKAPNCTCHSSCKACNYYGIPPTELGCISCADGSNVTEVFDDGAGYCEKVQGCYDYYKGENIPNCSCHSSCEACWFHDNSTTEFDCITCADGSDINEIYHDGSGHCKSDVPSLLPSFRSSSQPSSVPSFQPSQPSFKPNLVITAMFEPPSISTNPKATNLKVVIPSILGGFFFILGMAYCVVYMKRKRRQNISQESPPIVNKNEESVNSKSKFGATGFRTTGETTTNNSTKDEFYGQTIYKEGKETVTCDSSYIRKQSQSNNISSDNNSTSSSLFKKEEESKKNGFTGESTTIGNTEDRICAKTSCRQKDSFYLSYEYFVSSNNDSSSQKKIFEIDAPPGELGIDIYKREEGGSFLVYSIKPSSVLSNQVLVGDKLVSIDGVDTADMSFLKIYQLLDNKSSRKLIFERNLSL